MKPVIWFNKHTRLWCLSKRNALGGKWYTMMQAHDCGPLVDHALRIVKIHNERKIRAH